MSLNYDFVNVTKFMESSPGVELTVSAESSFHHSAFEDDRLEHVSVFDRSWRSRISLLLVVFFAFSILVLTVATVQGVVVAADVGRVSLLVLFAVGRVEVVVRLEVIDGGGLAAGGCFILFL